MEENENNGTIIDEEGNEVFKPNFKDSKGTTANRRRMKILQQVGDEMIVEITNATIPSERGTALTAEMMNQLDKRVFDAEKNSAIAKEDAAIAKVKAEQAIEHASDEKGTMIYVGGELQQAFNMDDKADKLPTNQAISELNSKLVETKQSLSNLAGQPIVAEVKVEIIDGVKTFIF